MSHEKRSQKKRSLPPVVTVAVALAVFVAALLPFVSTGEWAHGIEFAFVVLIVVVAVAATVAAVVAMVRVAGGTGRVAGGRGGTGFGRRIAAAAVAVLISWPLLQAFQGSSQSNRPEALSQEQQIQGTMKTLRHCETAKACVQRVLHEGKWNRKLSNKPGGLQK